jgi:hypothetical protein
MFSPAVVDDAYRLGMFHDQRWRTLGILDDYVPSGSPG